MRVSNAWLGAIALALLGLLQSGCGGSKSGGENKTADENPEPSADAPPPAAQAAEAPAAPGGNAPAASAPAEGATAKPDAGGNDEMLAMAKSSASGTPPANSPPPPAGGSGASAPESNPPPQSQSSSGGSGASAPPQAGSQSGSQAGPSATPMPGPGGGSSGPQAPNMAGMNASRPPGVGGPGGYGNMPQQDPGGNYGRPPRGGMPMPGQAGGSSSGGSGQPGAGSGSGSDSTQPGAAASMPNVGVAPGGGRPGGPGGPGGGPGSGGSGKAPSFQDPYAGAQSFLDALKAKDPALLQQATALRSPTEAKTEAHRELFDAIQKSALDTGDFDKLVAAFDGMSIQDKNVVKSTGLYGIIVGKMSGRDRLTRTLYVRKEAAGWKVVDFGAIRDFKPNIGMPNTGGGTGRNSGGRR
jgi:hypothetical protein